MILTRIRLRWRLFALAFLVVALAGCGAASTAAAVTSAVHDTIEVLKTARTLICTTKLDPLLGDPREGQPRYVVGALAPPPPSSGGATLPPADASAPSDAAVLVPVDAGAVE